MLTLVAAAAVICLAGSSLPLVAGGQIGDVCTLNGSLTCDVINSYCQKNAACLLGECQCNTGYAAFNTSLCLKTSLRLGVDACVHPLQCGTYASCVSGLCQCTSSYYRVLADGVNCDQGVQVLGGACTVSSQCGSRALCNTTTLTCTCSNPLFIPLSSNIGCRALTNGEACTGSACDTNDGLTCTSGTCQCVSDHFWANVTLAPNPPDFKCIPTGSSTNQGYGQDCADLSCGSDTVMMSCQPGLTCKQCPETTTPCTARKCLYDYNGLIGDTCTLDGTRSCTVPNSYCLKSSLCQLGTCQCSNGYVNLDSTNSTCAAARLDIGSTCVNALQCGLNTECRGTTRLACQCLTSYTMEVNNIDCTLGQFPIGNGCFIDSDCGLLATCQGGVCACSNGDYVPSGQFGCRYLTYNEACTANNGCNTNIGLSCDAGSNTCQCSGGQVWTNAVNGLSVLGYQCVDPSAIFNQTYGSGCADYTTGCGIVGSLRACVPGLMCSTCPENAGTCSNMCLIDKNQQYCLSSPCQNGATCTNLPSAYSCACVPGWWGVNCELASVGNGLVGSLCTLNGSSPCFAANSYCLKNTVCQLGACQCAPGYINLDNTNSTCVQDNVQVGQACQATVQCGIGATCSASRCSCPSNFRTSPNGIDCLRGTVPLNMACVSTDFPSLCGANAYCKLSQCACLNTEYQPSEENSFDCRTLSNGEACTPSFQACDASVNLTCDAGTRTCQCPSGQVWGYVPAGVPTPGYQCYDPAAVFGQTYGQSCHDLLSTCSSSSALLACTPDLVCDECPEDANSCNRKCLAIDNSTVTTTAAPTTTTAATTTTTTTTTTTAPTTTTGTTTTGSSTTTTAGSSTTTTTGSSTTTTTTTGSSTTTTAAPTTTTTQSTTTKGSTSTPVTSSTSSTASSPTSSNKPSSTTGAVSVTTPSVGGCERMSYGSVLLWAVLFITTLFLL